MHFRIYSILLAFNAQHIESRYFAVHPSAVSGRSQHLAPATISKNGSIILQQYHMNTRNSIVRVTEVVSRPK